MHVHGPLYQYRAIEGIRSCRVVRNGLRLRRVCAIIDRLACSLHALCLHRIPSVPQHRMQALQLQHRSPRFVRGCGCSFCGRRRRLAKLWFEVPASQAEFGNEGGGVLASQMCVCGCVCMSLCRRVVLSFLVACPLPFPARLSFLSGCSPPCVSPRPRHSRFFGSGHGSRHRPSARTLLCFTAHGNEHVVPECVHSLQSRLRAVGCVGTAAPRAPAPPGTRSAREQAVDASGSPPRRHDAGCVHARACACSMQD